MPKGSRGESDVCWSPEALPPAGELISLQMQNPLDQGLRLALLTWSASQDTLFPVFLLDTDVEGNEPYDRRLTDKLYGGDTYYRLCQETVLGLGGVHLLHKLGCLPAVYHMNEGHAALLALGLLEDRLEPGASLATATEEDRLAVAKQCVFTTHTPRPSRP